MDGATRSHTARGAAAEEVTPCAFTTARMSTAYTRALMLRCGNDVGQSARSRTEIRTAFMRLAASRDGEMAQAEAREDALTRRHPTAIYRHTCR